MFQYIYSRPLGSIILIVVVSVIAWAFINRRFSTTEQGRATLKRTNATLLNVEIVTILYFTLLLRTSGERDICIIPFYSFVMAQEQVEMYRTMLMNVFLFVPFGMTMPYVLKGTKGRRIWKTISTAFVYAIGIEVVQGIFGLGRAEVDDVLCNVLGTGIGCMSYWMSKLFLKKEDKCI